MCKTCKRDLRGVRQEKAADTQLAQSWQEGAARKAVITQTLMRPCRIVKLCSNILTLFLVKGKLQRAFTKWGMVGGVDMFLPEFLSLDTVQRADREDKNSGLIYASA